jgi:arylsulfatase A-like enzyme
MFMIANKKWKLIHCEGGFRPLLFDLDNDPQELVDLGESTAQGEVIDDLYDHLFAWARRPSQRTTRSLRQLEEMRVKSRKRGIVLGVYDEKDAPLELTVKYRGRKACAWRQR